MYKRSRGSVGWLMVTLILAWAAPTVAADQAGRWPHGLPRLLLITAHPDDETLFNLGYFRERGWPMQVALVTNGEHGGVVQGLKADFDPQRDEDILIELDPAPGVWLTSPPAGPRIAEIATIEQLARQRRDEFLGTLAFHGVTAAYVLSGLDTFDFEDSWDNGVANWDLGLLRTRLALVARRARPDLVITLNPGETWAHRQHTGLGRIVAALHAEGLFDTCGRDRPALYGLREHGWYEESLIPQAGDAVLPRARRSAVLGQTYAEYWRTATWYYLSQSSHPVWFAARAGVGLLPGYADADLIRRLDDGPMSASLEALLERFPPSARLQARLPPAPILVDLSDIPANAAHATPCRDDGVSIFDRTGDPGRR